MSTDTYCVHVEFIMVLHIGRGKGVLPLLSHSVHCAVNNRVIGYTLLAQFDIKS